MGNVTKVFVFLFVLGVINAMPVEEKNEQQPTVDAAESNAETVVNSLIIDELTRQKRQCK